MSAPALIDRFRDGFPQGYTVITTEGEAGGDTGVDFGIARLGAGAHEEASAKESIWVLLEGEALLSWDGQEREVQRASLFDEAPTALHVPAEMAVRIRTKGVVSEWAVARAHNERRFAPKLFRPDEIVPEYRGAGLVQGTSLRNVRLIFDYGNRKESNLVIGEVVNYPGRWSSYPPHTHPQAEIYHYRFTQPQGYGHAELGEEVHKVRTYDTLKILNGATHAQVSAPGYGMYYLWIVRHLPGNPYKGFTFQREHEWVLDPRNQGWEPKP